MYSIYIIITLAILLSPWSVLLTISLDGQFSSYPGLYHKDEIFVLSRLLMFYTPLVFALLYYSNKKKIIFKLSFLLIHLFFAFLLFRLFATHITLGIMLSKFSSQKIYTFIFLVNLLLLIFISPIILFLIHFSKPILYMITNLSKNLKVFFKEFSLVASNQKIQILISFIIVSIIFLIIYFLTLDLYIIING